MTGASQFRLAPLDGALRVRLDEPDWAAILGGSGLRAGEPLLAPLTDPSPDVPDLASVQAARLALTGPVRVHVASSGGGLALVAALGLGQDAAAGLVRRMGPDGISVPGVEMSAFPAERVVGEMLRLVPPAGTDDRAQGEALLVPVELALPLGSALAAGDELAAVEIAAQCGFDTVPGLLRDLADGLRGELTVSVVVAGSPTVKVLRFVCGAGGWVELGVDGARLRHTPTTREGIREALVFVVAGALNQVASAAAQ